MNTALLTLVVLVLALVLTAAVRRYALARSLVDRPNERSSHQVPTPRGGGVAIVIAFSVGLLWLWATGSVSTQATIALLGAGIWVALVGFLDDHGHIPARWRLVAHFIGAAWALFWLDGFPLLNVFGEQFALGWAGHIAGALFLVWLLNLYNFMDGIDAIAGIEAVTVALAGAFLWWLVTGSDNAFVPALLGAASAGFLAWNLPPARIFMGDVGSGFLGVVLAIFAVWSAQENPQLFWSWTILLGVFVVDATVTLVRRVMRGEPFYEAHRSHAYQYASRRFGQHRIVSLAVGAINLAWLLPLAALVALGHLDGLTGTLVAYAPLVWLVFRYKAGAKELQG
jgi:Fuc2NAc and GlcNAc transferase